MQKVILVDAWNTLVIEMGIDKDLQELLDSFENRKIILTNANDEEQIKLGLVDLPYEMFTLAHNPDKVDPEYYSKMLEHFELLPDQVVYFEHNEDAVTSSQRIGIETWHYDKDVRDIEALEDFLKDNL